MLHITKAFLPAKEDFLKYIDSIWDTHTLTNNGPFVVALEEKLKNYSGCNHVLACANGTIVLQMALRALNITGEVITTPFSYVATTNAILWERCKPVYVDINKEDFTIDADKIERAVTKDTQAILATHVYGYPCNIEKIEKIASKYNLKVIYDGAHAFGSRYKNKSILSFGDITTCSFHATKLFHSAEGGALFLNNKAHFDQLSLYRSFGHRNDDYYTAGINAKMSELHAAMGLCVIDRVDEIILNFKKAVSHYNKCLSNKPAFQAPARNKDYYGYYPILFENEKLLMQVIKALNENNIFPRRYFYPSLNKLPFLTQSLSCPVSESISERILCLPISYYITENEIEQICTIIDQAF